VTPPAAPFELPPIITYAVPGFVLLIIIEMIVVKLTKKGRYEFRDSASSLAMGFGNRVFGIAFGGLAVLAYFAVYEFRLFNLGWTAPVMVACTTILQPRCGKHGPVCWGSASSSGYRWFISAFRL
jgi:hypothetical protein